MTHLLFRHCSAGLSWRRRAALLAGCAALAFAAAAAALSQPAAARAPIGMYRGLGTWVDMYDPKAWNNPAAAAQNMKSHGVRTLYVETANYHWPTAINRPAALSGLIRECHARGIKVVAWYLPGFKDLDKDFRRARAAIRYRTPDGQKFDSFALDIEASIVKPASTRSARLKKLSARIRRLVGSRYPLGAIIPSPAGMAMHTSYWPDFPYKAVAAVYDVMVPMGYYTYHGDGYANAYRDTRNNIRIIREKTGRSSIPIHVIGGSAFHSSGTETQAYVRALREYGGLGGSLYDWATTNAADWGPLANVRTNRVQKPALPVAVGHLAPLGNCPDERTHPKEVFYSAPAQNGDRVLRFRLYDVGADEVRLLVNWKPVGPMPEGAKGEWTGVRTVAIPKDLLNGSSRNVIGFVATGDIGSWSTWGVRDVTLAPP